MLFRSTISKINRGLISGDRDKYFSKTKESENHVEILTGSDILRYNYVSPKEYILFEKPKTAGGSWDKNVHFADFKICIRQIGNEPIATLIDKPFAVTGNIFTVINDNLNLLKYELAIINSSLIKYFWRINFHDFKTTFPQVTINSLHLIPIKIDEDYIEEIISITDIILDRIENPDILSKLENQIDQLVYKLYDLTEEEIKIVEGV